MGQVNKVLRFVFLAVCLLKISSIFSLYFNDFTAVKEDSWRDYLIGRHVTYYGESPGTGPYTSLLNSRFTSPFYYYIVALIVKVWDDIRSLFLVNIFLQVVSVLLSYLIARKLFNEKVALTTLVLVVFGVRNMEIMAAYWHAWVNIPLILLSFYLLAAVKKTKKNVVLLSSVILSVASIIHMSGYIFLVIAYGFIFFKKENIFTTHLFCRSEFFCCFICRFSVVFKKPGLGWVV